MSNVPLFFGGKEWCNELLRVGVDVCKGRYGYGVYVNRVFEVKYYIRLLREFNYVREAERLGEWLVYMFHFHRGVRKGCTVGVEVGCSRVVAGSSNIADILF